MLCHISGAVFGSYGVSVAAVVTRCQILRNWQTAAGVVNQLLRRRTELQADVWFKD